MKDSRALSLTTTRQFRAALVRSERKRAATLIAAFAAAWRGIRHELGALLTALAADAPVGPHWLYQDGRLRRFEDAALREFAAFAGTAASAIHAEQQAAVTAAQAQAVQLVRLAAPNAGAVLAVRDAGRAGLASDGAPLARLFVPLPGQTARGLRDAVVDGVLLGQSPAQIARAAQQAGALALGRTLTISRTETAAAARDTLMDTYRANRHSLRGWRWIAGLSPNCCAACWAMDGSVHGWDEDLDDHANGACEPAAIGPDEADDDASYGASVFHDLSDDDQQQILGPGKFALYRDGTITLDDLVGWRYDARFGRSIREVSIPEALKSAARRTA